MSQQALPYTTPKNDRGWVNFFSANKIFSSKKVDSVGDIKS